MMRVSSTTLVFCILQVFVARCQIQFGGNSNDIVFDETDAAGGSHPSCTTSDQKDGLCQPLAQCAIFYAEIASLLDTICEIGNGQQGVCCPLQSHKPTTGSQRGPFISKPPSPPVTIPTISMQQVQQSVDVGLQRVQDRERNVNQILFVDKIQVPQNSPAASHQRFFTTTNSILDEGNKAQLSIESSLNLVDNFRLSRLQGTFALPHISLKNTKIESSCPSTSRCNAGFPYRTMDGSCNNQQNTDWGKAGTAFQRILSPKYGDGVNSPREFTAGGQPLPSPRFISSRFVPDQNNPYNNLTLMVMQWGQFLDHDLTHTPIAKGPNQTFISCCNNGKFLASNLVHPDCFAIHIPPNDPFYSQFSQECMEFVRSLPAPRRECTFGPREQLNQITGWLDGSNVYGSSDQKANSLREFSGGRLLQQRNGQKGLLPGNPSECTNQQQQSCFRAGDVRVNEQVDLALLHTIFAREHNRIAGILQQQNPNWSDEILYQESRRLVIAIMSQITYNEFLPLVLGPDFMRTFKLHPSTTSHTSLYDPSIDARITNAFAAAAYRFGHTLVQGNIKGFNRFGSLTDQLALDKTQFSPFSLYDNMDNFVRGLVNQECQQFDNFVSQALTNHLFQGSSQFGLDLVALNIQRGRDHGIPPYNEWREACHLPKLTSWDDLSAVMTPQASATLQSIYNSVDDIDLFVGGLGERPLPNAILGPVFVCIVGDQFARLKLGDRFFYEERTARFTEGQLNQIRKVSLARVLCDNSDDIDVIQPLVFQQASFLNKRQACNSNAIPGIDFNFWREARRDQQQIPGRPQQGFQNQQGQFQNQGRPIQNQQFQRPFPGQGIPPQGRPFQNQRRPFNG